MGKLKTKLKDIFYLAFIIISFVFVGNQIFRNPTSGWKTDFNNRSIDLDEVISGGVPRDGIPPIDEPRFDLLDNVSDLQPQSPIVVVSINNDTRGYPLEILIKHEIVNDIVGATPVAVTFCPLCNSAIVYNRTIDGNVLRFGVSGNLRNSDLIMWDDKTESWWQQLTGEGIVGDYNGYQLDFVSSQLISFGVFQEQYPDGKVLRGPFGSYGRNPYVGYDSTSDPFLFNAKVDNRLFATERVLALQIGNQPIAYPFSTLREKPVINDTIKDTRLVIFWQGGAASALDESDIDSSKDVGMALMYSSTLSSGKTLTFRYEDGLFRDNETNSIWNIIGEATGGSMKGAVLDQLDAYPHFWFAWAAFYPDTLLYES